MKRTIKLTAILCLICILCSSVFTSCKKDEESKKKTDNNAQTEESIEVIAMQLGDVKVTKNMMAYFFRNTYANYLGQIYNSQMQLAEYYAQFGLDSSTINTDPFSYLGIDSSKSLKEQLTSDGTSTQYDYFLSMAQSLASEYLVYAAEAKASGIELSAEEKTEIEASFTNLILNVRYSAGMPDDYTEDQCCALAYGSGVKKSDVIEALSLEALAKKMSEEKGIEIEKEIESDDELAISTYNADPKRFNYVDYLSISFNVYYEDILITDFDNKSAEELTTDERVQAFEIYKQKIEAARNAASTLLSKTNVEDYKSFVIDYMINEDFQYVYDYTTKKLSSDKLPAEQDLATIKEKIKAAVLAEITEGQTSAINDVILVSDTNEYKIYDIKITKEFSEVIKSFKENLFDSVISSLDACSVTHYSYIPDDELDDTTIRNWLFDSSRKELDIARFDEGDGANGAEINVVESMFSSQVILLTKPSYRVDTLSRDFAFLLFTSYDAANTAIESVKKIEGLNKDKFLTLAYNENNPAANSQFIEDFAFLYMQDENFDKWLFAEDLKEGSYTTEPIAMSDGSYMVALYVKQNSTPHWKYLVRDALIYDAYESFEEEMFKKLEKDLVSNASALTALKDSATVY